MGLEKFGGFLSLSKNVNKVKDADKLERTEGVISDFEPELKTNIPDADLIKLKKQWEIDWNKQYTSDLKPKLEKAERYWLGNPEAIKNDQKVLNQFDIVTFDDNPNSDNLIFEALETFLPAATRQNPEPTVSSDKTKDGMSIADTLKNLLIYLSDVLRLKTKLKKVLRFWAIYYVGAVKLGWSEKNNEISIKPLRIQSLILDPNGTIDDDGEYTGEYVGEYIKEQAKVMVVKYPTKAKEITAEVKGNMNTKIQYIEWWTEEILFWTLGDTVLDKIKNPHWNYDTEEPAKDENGELIITEVEDAKGNIEQVQDVEITPGKNHFKHPKIPYLFLNIFSLNKKPYDETSLIEQNIPQQDIINKRQRQIDMNVDNMNGGWVVSLQQAGMTKEQASIMARTLRKGGLAAIPQGDARSAIEKITGNSLPADVFNSQQDARNELRSIFGTTGISSQGVQSEDTVRGKIITRGSDVDRIGGGVSEFLEQYADKIYNWFTQMIYVYFDLEHLTEIIGPEEATKFLDLINTVNKTMVVSVKEGSLIPKDSLTQRNEAVDLFTANALDPVTLFKRLDFADPVDAARRLVAWKSGQLMDEQGDIAAEQVPTEEGGGEAIPPAGEQPVEEDLLSQVPIQ